MTIHDDIHAIPVSANLLDESPLWHPVEQALYWCDIPGRQLHRYTATSGEHQQWNFHTEVACCAARQQGGLLLALRDGLWHFNPADETRTLVSAAPYTQAAERFNDGKVDAQGRFWCGTIFETRDHASAALYRWTDGKLLPAAGDITVSNGLAWSPDGAVVDAEGCYWVAMSEGARILRFSPSGELLQTLHLPVRCSTMPCFGGPDLQTLFITTSCQKRLAEELAAMPLSGHVLQLRVNVSGLPTHFVDSP